MRINQTIRNYETNDLLDNADLFYDDQGEPFTKGTIKHAEDVTEYSINDKRVTVEEYDNISKRFEFIPLEL